MREQLVVGSGSSDFTEATSKSLARGDAPVVDGQPVLVGAFGVEKRGTRIPPATRVLRLIVNAIPRNKQQIAIKGDIERMPVGGEWLHIALQSDEIVLWSSDDIQGCFHVFSLPPAWRRWMILSKPIRVALLAGRVGVLASNDQVSRGGNAPQPVVSDGSRLIWLALAVIPMGWLSATSFPVVGLIVVGSIRTQNWVESLCRQFRHW